MAASLPNPVSLVTKAKADLIFGQKSRASKKEGVEKANPPTSVITFKVFTLEKVLLATPTAIINV